MFWWFVSALLIIIFYVIAATVYTNVIKLIKFKQANKHSPIPVQPLNFGIGQTLDFFDPLKVYDAYLAYVTKFKNYKGIYAVTYFLFPNAMVTDPELVRQITVTKANKFKKSELTYNTIKLLIGDGLVTLEGEHWKKDRSLLNPIFSSKNISAMMDKMFEETERHVEYWKQNIPITDMQDSISALTLKIVTACVYGSDLKNYQQIGQVYKELMQSVLPMFIMGFISDKLYKLPLPINKKFFNDVKKIEDLVTELINERKSSPSSSENMDMLSLMLQAVDDGYKLSPQSIMNESTTFLFAGHETTSSLLGFVFYHLAVYPDIQKRVQDEIDQIIGTNTRPTYDQVHDLKFMKMVIDETLRLYPPAYVIDKEAIEDVQIGEYHIPKGVAISIDMINLHRNPNIWENPHDFDPDRWQEDRIAKIPNLRYAFVPFSVGSRSCIGQMFVYTEAPLILSMILRDHTVKLADGFTKSDVVPDCTATVRPNKLHVQFEKRK